MEDLVQRLPEMIMESMSKLLDEKGVSSGNVTRHQLDDAIDAAFERFSAKFHAPAQPQVAAAAIAAAGNQAEPPSFKLISWGDGKYHRLPAGFILTARASLTSAAVKRTPRQAYFRWHMPDLALMLPALKYTDCGDYSIKNQKKRFSEWRTVCAEFDKNLDRAGVTMSGNTPTGFELRRRFEKAIEMHFYLVSHFHSNPRKRQQLRARNVAKVVSTIADEIRDYRKGIVRMNEFIEGFSSLLLSESRRLILSVSIKGIERMHEIIAGVWGVMKCQTAWRLWYYRHREFDETVF